MLVLERHVTGRHCASVQLRVRKHGGWCPWGSFFPGVPPFGSSLSLSLLSSVIGGTRFRWPLFSGGTSLSRFVATATVLFLGACSFFVTDVTTLPRAFLVRTSCTFVRLPSVGTVSSVHSWRFPTPILLGPRLVWHWVLPYEAWRCQCLWTSRSTLLRLSRWTDVQPLCCSPHGHLAVVLG